MDINEFAKEMERRDTNYYKSLSTWFCNILIASCGFLGVLIGLSDNTGEPYHIRLAFLLSIVQGTLGVLLLSVSLLFETIRAERIRSEIRRRVREEGISYMMGTFGSTKPPNYLLAIGIFACISLFLFLIFIVYYVAVKNLPEFFENY
jgi:O-antigen/teichoic acid export membrane protein